MTTLIVTHEVEDVAHWQASPRREEFFGSRGFKHRTFVDPDNSNLVGLIIECPSLEALNEALQAEGANEAMKFDRVRPDTIRILVEG
jgi:hypothetical protein